MRHDLQPSRDRKIVLSFGIIVVLASLSLRIVSEGSSPTACLRVRNQKEDIELEITDLCDGMSCDKGNKTSIKLFGHGQAEYRVSSSPHGLDSRGESVLSRKSVSLSADQFARLMSLAETTGFLRAAGVYDSKITLADSVYLTVIVYRKKHRQKVVMLRNYFRDGTQRVTPVPAAVKEIVEIGRQMMASAKEKPR